MKVSKEQVSLLKLKGKSNVSRKHTRKEQELITLCHVAIDKC
jgi:hypothetical protein